MQRAHNDIIDQQFGPQAQAYVESSAHSSGPDLVWLEATTREHRPSRILDLGCGGGHASYRMAPYAIEVVACDLSGDMLAAVTAEAARRNITNISTCQGAAEALPFADGEFDMVVSRLSAHHWHDLDAGLREARRVVTPGARGVFIDVVAPAHPVLDTYLQTIELLRDPSHVRDYRLDEWTAALGRAGFDLRQVVTHDLSLDFAAWIERMHTPLVHVEAIRSLQARMSSFVSDAFAVRDDGSFTIPVAMFELVGR